MIEHGGHYAKWDKSDKEILYDITYLKKYNKVVNITKEADSQLQITSGYQYVWAYKLLGIRQTQDVLIQSSRNTTYIL